MSVADADKGYHNKYIKNNKGSSTVEVSIIIPIILFIILIIIQLHLTLLSEGERAGKIYNSLYTVSWEENKTTDGCVISDGYVWIDSSTDNLRYKTEYDKCSSRLRRWQLYGDVIRE